MLSRLIPLVLFSMCVHMLEAQRYVIDLKIYTTEDGMSQRDARSIYQDELGYIWVGTSGGLNRFDGYDFKLWTKADDGLKFDQIDYIEADERKGFLRLYYTALRQSYNELTLFNPATKEIIDLGEPDTRYQSFGEKQKIDVTLCKGKIRVDSMLVTEAETGKTILNLEDTLPGIHDRRIYAWILDKSGALWIGYDFGLVRLDIYEQRFHNYLYNGDNQTVGKAIRGIISISKDSILTNTQDDGQFLIHTKTQTETFLGKRQGYSFAFGKDEHDNIYTLSGERLTIFNKDHYEDQSTWGYDFAWSIYCLGNKRVISGIQSKGLALVDINAGTSAYYDRYNQFTELRENNIYHIDKDPSGQIWLCAETGFYTFDINKGVTARYWKGGKGEYHIPCDIVLHFHVDADGIYWLATRDAGLIQWDKKNNRTKRFGRKTGFPNEAIYAVYEDKHQHLWLPSDVGIIQFDKQRGEVRSVYGTNQGISHQEFNRTSHAVGPDGTIYFGGLNGITSFNPEDFYTQGQASHIPLLISECFRAKGTSGQVDTITTEVLRSMSLTLSPSDPYFEIDLTMLSFGNTSKIQYGYRYDNQKEWTFQSNRRLHTGGLGYGKHTLHIKAQNAEGLWSDEITLTIYQLRPYYLQLWFILLMAGILGFSIWLFIKRRTRALIKTKQLLEETVKERTHELQEYLVEKDMLIKEIHHRVKNNLETISSLLELQSEQTEDDIAKSALLEGQNRVQSIALIHHKLYQQDDMVSIEFKVFVNDLYSQILSLFSSKRMHIETHFDLPDIFIDIDTAIPLGLILNELLTNSFKYAFRPDQDNRLYLNFETTAEDSFRLTYRDNGPGLPENFSFVKPKSLGMRLISSLSKQLGGKMEYRYQEGSVFEINFIGTRSRKTRN